MSNKSHDFAGARTVLRRDRDARARPARKHILQRRRADRKSTHKRISIWLYSNNIPCRTEQAVLVDLSVCGAGLILNVPMKPGDRFVINIERFRTSLVYHVVRCRRCGDAAFQIGAEFFSRMTNGNRRSLESDVEHIRQAILG